MTNSDTRSRARQSHPSQKLRFTFLRSEWGPPAIAARGLSARLLAVCKPSELIRGGRRPGAAVPVAAMLPLGRKVRHARPGPRRTISRSGSRTESRNVPSTSAWLRDEACPRGSGTEVERPVDRRTEAWRRASGIAPCRERRRRPHEGQGLTRVQTRLCPKISENPARRFQRLCRLP
jgi:hypothetical protein